MPYSEIADMLNRMMTIEYWMDGGWFIGRLRDEPDVAAEAETLEELHAAIGRAYAQKLGQTEQRVRTGNARPVALNADR